MAYPVDRMLRVGSSSRQDAAARDGLSSRQDAESFRTWCFHLSTMTWSISNFSSENKNAPNTWTPVSVMTSLHASSLWAPTHAVWLTVIVTSQVSL